MNHQITNFKDVADAIQLFAQEVQNVLQDLLLGIYIHGSLALGDFNPTSSDIDFMVVTKDKISNNLYIALEKMHKQLLFAENIWTNKLEGSYLPRKLLSRKQPPEEVRLYVNKDKFLLARYGFEWILELYVLREYGFCVIGPGPQKLIAPISSDELQEASLKVLEEWWVPMLTEPTTLQSDDEYQAYAVLTMCRILYLFTYGKMVSKKAAADWAEKSFAEPWKELIEDAINWKYGLGLKKFSATREFIKFTLNYINRL